MTKSRFVTCAAAVVAASALIFCTVPTTYAQGGAPAGAPQAQPGPPQPMALNDPRNVLHLTADQQKKAIAINQQFIGTVQALGNNKALTDNEKRSQFAGAQADAQKQLMSILTPSQRTDLLARQQRQKAYMAGVAEDAKKIAAIDKEFQDSLTPTQKTKIAALKAEFAKKIGPIEANKSMTPLQQGAAERGIAAAYQSRLKSILTAKQVSEWQDSFRYQDEARALERLAQETGL